LFSHTKVVPLESGELMIAAYDETQALPSDLIRPALLRIDDTGNPEWAMVYPLSGDRSAYVLGFDRIDDDFVMAGYARNEGLDDVVLWVMRVDSKGGVVWLRKYGTHGKSLVARALVVDRNNEIVLAGETDARGNRDFMVMKLDGGGRLVWERSFDRADEDEFAFALTESLPGSYVVVGSGGAPASNGDIWVVELDSAGNPLGELTFESSGMDVAHDVITTAAGDFVLVGGTDSFGPVVDGTDKLFIRFTMSGAVSAWTYGFPGRWDDPALAVMEGKTGDFFIAGKGFSPTSSLSTGEIIRTDAMGALVDYLAYGGSGGFNFDRFEDIDHTQGDEFVVTGSSVSANWVWHTNALWFVNANQNGFIPGCPVTQNGLVTKPIDFPGEHYPLETFELEPMEIESMVEPQELELDTWDICP
jgi:hypothetical protein